MPQRRRLSRRRVLAMGGGAAGIAGIGAVAFFIGQREGAAPARVAPGTSALPSPTATADTLPSPTPFPRGGVAHLVANRSWNLDTFDAQQTGERSVIEILGRTHSRLVAWLDITEPRLGPGLATSWEQPDASTLVLHLHPSARWHDIPPVAGRPFDAQDAALHLQRMLRLVRDGALPSLQDVAAYSAIAQISAPDDHTVRIETSRPDPFLLETLAGAAALLQAREAVDAFGGSWQKLRPESVIGTGPFVFTGFDGDDARFTAFRQGHQPAALDAIVVSPPGRDDASLFLAGERDEVIARDRRDAPRIRQGPVLFTESSALEDSPVITTFFAGSPPWNNPELIRAISGALNRGELARRLFAGRAAASSPLVTPATPAFGLSESELAEFPGYRADFTSDAAEARRRWEAAGGPALGAVTIDFPSIFDPLYSASSIVPGLLAEVLGNEFRATVDTYTAISAKALDRYYGSGRASLWLGWGPPIPSPDPSRNVMDTLLPNGPTARSLGLPSIAPEELGGLSLEFGLDHRKVLVRAVVRSHLAAGSPGVLGWLLQQNEIFRRSRFSRPSVAPFWTQESDAQAHFIAT